MDCSKESPSPAIDGAKDSRRSSRIVLNDSPDQTLRDIKLKKPTLAYKDDALLANFKREDDTKDENDDDDELEPFALLVRTILCPIILPAIIGYVWYSARARNHIKEEIRQIKVAELMAANPSISENEINSFDLGYESDETEDQLPLKQRLIRHYHQSMTAFKTSFKNFADYLLGTMKAQVAKKETTYTVRSGSHKSESWEKFDPATEIARTDRITYPYDGVYVKNIFVDLKDQDRLKELIEQERNETEDDATGDVAELLLQSKQRTVSSEAAQSTTPTVSEPIAKNSSSKNAKVTSFAEAAVPKKSSKPKKAPPTDSVVRVNPEVAGRISVGGPSISHLDQALNAADKLNSPLRAKIRQDRRPWSPDSMYDSAFSSEIAQRGEASPLSGLSSYIPEDSSSPHVVDYLILQYHGSVGSPKSSKGNALGLGGDSEASLLDST